MGSDATRSATTGGAENGATDAGGPDGVDRGTQLRRIAIGVVIALVAVMVAYLIGRAQMGRVASAAEQRADAVEAQLAAQQQDWRSAQDEVQRDVALLEARRRLTLALDALDARNFGISEQHLRAAAGWFEQARPSGDLAALSQEVRQTRITVTEDLEQQRATLRGFVQRFDRLVPPPEPDAPPPARRQPVPSEGD
jgi:hypothetical protein